MWHLFKVVIAPALVISAVVGIGVTCICKNGKKIAEAFPRKKKSTKKAKTKKAPQAA